VHSRACGGNLWERQDLEAWVASAPDLARGDFTVLTSEFDRFDRTSERLDVIGLVRIEEGHGRLVVVELKRDGSSTTVDLQAIKYAAYVASSQFADVVDMYARHHDVDESHAKEALFDLLGGDEDTPPIIDSTPRIVLVAGDFRPEVTTTVLWLIDNYEVDIRCVRLQPFEIAGRIVVSSETIIPLPEAEQNRLGVQRKRREEERAKKEPTEWTWDAYASRYSSEQLAVARCLFDRLSAYVEEHNLPWTPALRYSWLGFKRRGDYYVPVIKLRVEKPMDFAVKLPANPKQLGLVNPYPDLKDSWDEHSKEWSWAIASVDLVPDVASL